MAGKKRFLLRVDEAVYAGVERWAADELRSVNGQIEFLLREALKRAGRWPPPAAARRDASTEDEDEEEEP
jgi:hypothetical protein